MNDATDSTQPEKLEDTPPEERRLTAQTFDDMRIAVETLDLRGNQSGRIHFAKAWPAVAGYLFGDELIAFDADGVEDKERREELEQRAENKQYDLINALETLEEDSAEYGALKLDYAEGVVKKYGREMSLHLYSEAIVDRFAPAPPSAQESIAPANIAPTPPPQEEAAASPPPAPPPVVGEPTTESSAITAPASPQNPDPGEVSTDTGIQTPPPTE